MSRVRQIRVGLPSGSYPVTVGDGLLGQLDEVLPEPLHGRTMALVTNEKVDRLHGRATLAALKRLGTVHKVLIPDGERHKTLATAQRVYRQLVRNGIDRSGVVVALGGGVIGDLAGFVAATYLRGLRFVQLPTTLLAQVDASVGGKVAVNLAEGKNLVGAFHQPAAVVADTKTLDTLPRRELTAGMMEVIKYALLGDLHLWKYLKGHVDDHIDWSIVVEASVKDKARVVAADERESGHRRVLNLGHTLAHALESVTRYRKYLHGEAVGIGMVFASLLAQRLRRQSGDVVDEVIELVRRAGLEISLPEVPWSRIYPYFAADKKVQDGSLHFVLPVGLGRVQIITGIPEYAFRDAYLALKALARRSS
jgi:3-dehydroquinate synthase